MYPGHALCYVPTCNHYASYFCLACAYFSSSMASFWSLIIVSVQMVFIPLFIPRVQMVFIPLFIPLFLLCWKFHLNEPPHDKTNKMICAPSEDSDQPGHPPNLIRVFAVRVKKHWDFCYLLSAQWRLIRLGGCPGWSESSLGAHAILLVLLWGGSKVSFLTLTILSQVSGSHVWANSVDLDQSDQDLFTLFAIPSASFGRITLR